MKDEKIIGYIFGYPIVINKEGIDIKESNVILGYDLMSYTPEEYNEFLKTGKLPENKEKK